MPRTKKPATPDLEARVAALEKALSIVLVHIPAAFFETQDAADGPTRRILDELEDLPRPCPSSRGSARRGYDRV